MQIFDIGVVHESLFHRAAHIEAIVQALDCGAAARTKSAAQRTERVPSHKRFVLDGPGMRDFSYVVDCAANCTFTYHQGGRAFDDLDLFEIESFHDKSGKARWSDLNAVVSRLHLVVGHPAHGKAGGITRKI